MINISIINTWKNRQRAGPLPPTPPISLLLQKILPQPSPTGPSDGPRATVLTPRAVKVPCTKTQAWRATTTRAASCSVRANNGRRNQWRQATCGRKRNQCRHKNRYGTTTPRTQAKQPWFWDRKRLTTERKMKYTNSARQLPWLARVKLPRRSDEDPPYSYPPYHIYKMP